MTEAELRELEKEVVLLKARVDKETKGIAGWIKSVAVVLAFVAAVFAVPKGIHEFWQDWHSRPNTHLTPESYILLSYEPKAKMLSFRSDFTISNTGSRLDTITRAGATIKQMESDVAPLLSFGDMEVSFLDNKAEISRRFTVPKDSTRALTYQVTRYLADDKRQAFLVPKSRWQFVVELEDEFEKTYQLTYCFDVSQSLLEETVAATTTVQRKFVNPLCD